MCRDPKHRPNVSTGQDLTSKGSIDGGDGADLYDIGNEVVAFSNELLAESCCFHDCLRTCE